MTREIDPKLADSPAARMLAEGLARASRERGLSLRKVGSLLGYKQAVVLSHMASGRVPIPIDRAEELGRILGLDPGEFLAAVVRQRHPDVDWTLLANAEGMEEDLATGLATDLEQIAGEPISRLSAEHRQVLREVVASAHPSRRWVTEHEIPALELLRMARPRMREHGLEEHDRAAILIALQRKND